jgi:hypothetical protein
MSTQPGPIPPLSKAVPIHSSAFASSSSAQSSVWDRISNWASENKAVVYTIAGVAVIVTGAGVAYYLTDSVSHHRIHRLANCSASLTLYRRTQYPAPTHQRSSARRSEERERRPRRLRRRIRASLPRNPNQRHHRLNPQMSSQKLTSPLSTVSHKRIDETMLLS